jgi:membrane-associated phospholipid phosphatase
MSRQRVLAWGGPVLYASVFLGYAVWRGVPASRDILILWIALGLLAFSLSDLRRFGRGMVVEWLPFVFVLFAYDLLRGYADGLLATHYLPQIRAEHALFGTIPTVWLQDRLWGGVAHVQWYDYGGWFVYLTHFFATLLVAAVLWVRRPELFRRYAAMVSTLAVLGFTTYVLFPAAPPWLASDNGNIGPVERLVTPIWSHIPFVSFQTLFEKGERYSNQVAAVPSLHAAFALLISLFLWRHVSRRWRPLLVAYPVAMGYALVYLGEHYAVDILLGWVYAAAAFGLVELAVRSPRRAREKLAYLRVSAERPRTGQ